MKLIDLHKKWCRNGSLNGSSGLCHALMHTDYDDHLQLFIPTGEELAIHEHEGYNTAWWGEKEGDKRWGAYTPLRQTIVLLICAMNDEL